jgi:hypothetical protein
MERFHFYTRSFSKLWTLIARRNSSARRKSFPNTDDTRFLSFWRNATGNTRKIDALMTTHHLFWPNQRRKRAIRYRVGYGISIFHHVNGGRGGGVGSAQPPKGLDPNAHSEFSA